MVTQLVDDLNKSFAIKKLGSLHYFLGIEVFSNRIGIYLSQSKYIANLLTKVNMVGAKEFSTPATPRQTLSRSEGEAMENSSLYRSTVGALQYLTITRPDISYIASKLSQFLCKIQQQFIGNLVNEY